MTHDPAQRPAASRTRDLALPRVSIVIVNHNYGRFLDGLVASVRAQTYPEIECLIVDDASSDDSSLVLDRLEAGGDVHVIRRAVNGGQTQASLDGLHAATGAYVIFVDGDDLLLPGCVETHIYVHLSSRAHIGFTSGDMLQVADNQVVVTTGEDFNRYIRSGRGRKANAVRPFLGLADAPTRFAETARRLDGRIHFVPPLSAAWVWSPTSGNCWRRDALMMFADNPALASLRTGTDMYFALAIGALCGSALIDEPVFGYRIHGGNIFTQRVQLARTLAFRPGDPGDSNDAARLAVIDQFVARAERFAPNLILKLNLFVLLLRMDRPDPAPGRPRWARRSRLAWRLHEHRAPIVNALGHPLAFLLRLASGAPLR